MQIMFLRSKRVGVVVFFLLVSAMKASASSQQPTAWVASKEGLVQMVMADKSIYGLKVLADVEGVFYDKYKHLIGDNFYISVFQVSPSSSGMPQEFCGAGREVWLYVYKVVSTGLSVQAKVLVDSCLCSISITSQNSGAEKQDADFSSVQWQTDGFSIEWFERVDAAGRPLRSTRYVLRDAVFLPYEVLDK